VVQGRKVQCYLVLKSLVTSPCFIISSHKSYFFKDWWYYFLTNENIKRKKKRQKTIVSYFSGYVTSTFLSTYTVFFKKQKEIYPSRCLSLLSAFKYTELKIEEEVWYCDLFSSAKSYFISLTKGFVIQRLMLLTLSRNSWKMLFYCVPFPV